MGKALSPTDKAFPAWGRWRAERAGWGTSGMKESEEDRLKCAVYESTLSTADAVPLPQWGRLRYESIAFLDTTPFPMGKAKRRRLRRKKESQPRHFLKPMSDS